MKQRLTLTVRLRPVKVGAVLRQSLNEDHLPGLHRIHKDIHVIKRVNLVIDLDTILNQADKCSRHLFLGGNFQCSRSIRQPCVDWSTSVQKDLQAESLNYREFYSVVGLVADG